MFDFLKTLTLEQQALIILIFGLLIEKLFQLVKWLIEKLFRKQQSEAPSNRLNWELTMAKIATIESILDDVNDELKKDHENQMDIARKGLRLQEELHEMHLGQNAKDADGRPKWWFPNDMIASQRQLVQIMSEVLGELRAIRLQEGYPLVDNDKSD